jgi:CDP-paratose 2-epimerase
VIDYARSFDLPALVFRMSCIYGPHQCGTEDQGWVAHFALRTIGGDPITIYGDGRQVRDVLYVDDLVDAFLLAQENMARLKGNAFNIGGGAANAVSLIELIHEVAQLHGRAPTLEFGGWRTGDQRYYVTDHSRFTRATGWRPRVSAAQGAARMYCWMTQQHRREPPAKRTHGVPVQAEAAGLSLQARAAR